MEAKILRTLTGKMTLIELAGRMGFNEYRKEVFAGLEQLIAEEKVERSWDESGMSFYEKK